MALEHRGKQFLVGVGIAIILIVIARFSCSRNVTKPSSITKLPPHLSGLTIWVYKDLATGSVSPDQLVNFISHAGATGMIVKAGDSGDLGIKISKRRVPQFSHALAQVSHGNNIRCYAYFTGYFRSDSDVRGLVKNAIKTLHMDADGVIIDDVFIYGANRHKVDFVFQGLRHHLKKCTLCKGKIFAFSTFPHMLLRDKLPWDIPLECCDYYLPQVYWETFQITPLEVLIYMQSSWDGRISFRQVKTDCKIIPTVHTTDPTRRVSEQDLAKRAKKLDQFFDFSYQFYPRISLFRWGIISSQEKEIIKKWGWKFRQSHAIEDPSLSSRLRKKKTQADTN